MPNWGLLSGVGQGLERGFQGFLQQQQLQRDRGRQDKQDLLTNALQKLQLAKAGYEYNPEGGDITQTEKGQRKEQLDNLFKIYSKMSEDEQLGTVRGQSLRKKIDELSSFDEPSIGLLNPDLKPPSGDLPPTDRSLDAGTAPVTTNLATKMSNPSPQGLVNPNSKFIPGYKTKKDREMESDVKKAGLIERVKKEVDAQFNEQNPTAKFKSGPTETQNKVGGIVSGISNLNKAEQLILDGKVPQFFNSKKTFGLVSNEPLTTALTYAKDAPGRLQSGGALNDAEQEMYESLLPTYADRNDKKLMLSKLAEARRFLENKSRGFGVDPKLYPELQFEMEPRGGEKKSSSSPKKVIQNGHTYILNEQTGQYE